ncbi:hypothetical protein SUGI_0871700 [Cryptomeria japonica]|nr:hypothetical protein SUGI_0871700 [Cryptomeria japonica]
MEGEMVGGDRSRIEVEIDVACFAWNYWFVVAVYAEDFGCLDDQEHATEAYYIAAIKFGGKKAVTNFDTSRYDAKAIMNSRLPVGRNAKRRNKSSFTDCTAHTGSSLPSHTSLPSPFSYVKEGLVVSKAQASENMPSLSTSSVLVRARHENIMHDANWKQCFLVEMYDKVANI